jgi:uncharacterized membrane protein
VYSFANPRHASLAIATTSCLRSANRRSRCEGKEGGEVVIAAPNKPVHPALLELGEERARSVQNRVADAITRFAGSMWFAYLHIAWFAFWIVLGVEAYPYGLLTMIVSLEAIFLSTFVMISQNRADAKRQVLADHQWEFVQTEERQNEELLQLSKQILDLTTSIHDLAVDLRGPAPAGPAT